MHIRGLQNEMGNGTDFGGKKDGEWGIEGSLLLNLVKYILKEMKAFFPWNLPK